MRRGRSQTAEAQQEEPYSEDGAASSSIAPQQPQHRYPRVVIAESDAEEAAEPNPSTRSQPPPPFLQPFFPRADDPPFPTATVKLLNLCAGGAAVLATGRGLIAAAAAAPGTGGRAAAFYRGFAITFPIYLPAFVLGAAADHAFRVSGGGAEGRRRRAFQEEYDLP